MRFGLQIGNGLDPDGSLNGLIDRAQQVEKLGFDSLWIASIFNYDPMTVLAVIGQKTTRLELGTAVAVSYSRQPMIMAQQALTVAAACNDRFTLGLGVSHQFIVDGMMGLSYDKPARHMKEYLEVLMPLLRGEAVSFEGDVFRANAQLGLQVEKPPQVLLAALGPVMLKMAGSIAAGSSLWLVGAKTVETHIRPSLERAASSAGKLPPRIVCALPVVLTNNTEQAKTAINEALDFYKDLPAYRAMLDKENAQMPADVALIGDEASLRQQLAELSNAGVTDLNAVLLDVEDDSYERTLQFLANEIS